MLDTVIKSAGLKPRACRSSSCDLETGPSSMNRCTASQQHVGWDMLISVVNVLLEIYDHATRIMHLEL